MAVVGETKTNSITGEVRRFDGRNWVVVTPARNPLYQGQRLKPTSKDADELRDAASAAMMYSTQVEPQLNQFENLSKVQDTGFLRDLQAKFLNDPELQSMETIQNRLTPAQRPVNSGSSSDFEQKMYAQGVPNITRNKTTNQRTIQYMKQVGNQQKEYNDFLSAYARVNGGSTVGASAKFQEYLGANPIGAPNRKTWKQFYGLEPVRQLPQNNKPQSRPAQGGNVIRYDSNGNRIK